MHAMTCDCPTCRHRSAAEFETLEFEMPVARTVSADRRRGVDTLMEMYASDERFDDGLASFEYPLFHATEEEMDYFLGKLAKRVSRSVSHVARSVGQGVNAIGKVVPLSTLTSAIANTPMGFAVRAGVGAVSAAANGKNVFHGAVRSLASGPLGRLAVDTAGGVARGENLLKAAQRAGQAGIGDVRESLRFAAMVAPFVPGIGTGAAAALAAANALASGERISDALVAAARNAVPGGALAQTAFDTATEIAKGKSLSEAALNAARDRLPGGPLAKAAFDSGLALAKGRTLQDSLLAAGGRLLPKSPYAADVLSFVKKAAAGEHLGNAALSSAGNLVMKRIEQQTGPVLSLARTQARATAPRPRLPRVRSSVSREIGHSGHAFEIVPFTFGDGSEAEAWEAERRGSRSVRLAPRRRAPAALRRRRPLVRRAWPSVAAYDQVALCPCVSSAPDHADNAPLAVDAEPQATPPTDSVDVDASGETWLGEQAQPRSGRRSPVMLPTLTIRVQPFVVLDQFGFDAATLPARHAPIIERIARLVVASRASGEPIDTIRLVGHTDPVGPPAYNLDLAKRRAQHVEASLRAALTALGVGPPGHLSVVVQSVGETRPAVSDTSAAGRALNRRVAVFLPTTCGSFFAQYDLRFLPSDPVFGIPAHPNLTAVEKAQRAADVTALVGELVARRDRRAQEALAGRIPPPAALPRGVLRSRALRLSAAQLALYREYFADGRGGIEFAAFQRCVERFANGQLRSPMVADQAKGVGEPNGGFFFLFAEFAFLCIASRIEPVPWTQALRSFVKAQEVFMHVYRPSALSPPPAVGAALPVCVRDARGRPRARRGLDSYRNANFRATGASPTVGAGQSGPARMRALSAKYAAADVAQLQREAQANMQRAQCMP